MIINNINNINIQNIKDSFIFIALSALSVTFIL